MPLALLIFGVAFAAIGIWLTVRIVNRRERWAKWTLAASRFGAHRLVGFVYQPLMHMWWHGQPPRGNDMLDHYTRFAATPGWGMGLEFVSGRYS
jgi:hypothetical protein